MFGHSQTDSPFVVRCPGEGICERFTEAGGNTFAEKVENATPGCPRCRGNGPIPPEENEYPFSDFESGVLIHQLIPLVEKVRNGLVSLSELNFFEERIVLYWLQLERDFERSIQVRLGFFIDSWSKQK